MATEYDDEGNPVEQEDEKNTPAGLRKYANEQAERAKAAEAQLAEYRRKEAIRSAGLDGLNEDQLGVLQGNSAEELRQRAEKLGFIQPTPDVAPEVQAAHERVAEAAGSGQTQVSTSKENEYASAKTPEELLRIAQKHGSPTTWDGWPTQ